MKLKNKWFICTSAIRRALRITLQDPALYLDYYKSRFSFFLSKNLLSLFLGDPPHTVDSSFQSFFSPFFFIFSFFFNSKKSIIFIIFIFIIIIFIIRQTKSVALWRRRKRLLRQKKNRERKKKDAAREQGSGPPETRMGEDTGRPDARFSFFRFSFFVPSPRRRRVFLSSFCLLRFQETNAFLNRSQKALRFLSARNLTRCIRSLSLCDNQSDWNTKAEKLAG